MSLAVGLVEGGVSWVTLLLTLGILVVFLVLSVQRARVLYALRRLPSPPALPFLGNAIQLNCNQEEFFSNLVTWSREFGDVFMVWLGMRPFIFLYRSEWVQPLLSSSVHIDKSLEYEYIRPWLGTGLLTSSGAKWHTRRKMLTPSFHSGILEKYLRVTMREADILVSRLRLEVGKPHFDMMPYAKLAALDVICETAMGHRINAQTNCSDEYVLAVDKITAVIQMRFITLWMAPDFVFNRTSFGKEHNAALEVIRNFTNKVIAEKKADWNLKHDGNFNEPAKKGQALLDLLLKISQDGKVLSDEDIREEVDTFMFAGHDTVATSISWILYTLGRNPEYQKKILEEYDRVIGSEEITVDSLNRLEWLDACIKETWRLYPVAPLIARQTYKPLNIMGNDIPVGATILINLYLLHRDPRYFPQPEVYRPERFLPSAPKAPSFAYIPFSAGSRNCIGWRFAHMEVKVMIISILKEFDVRSLETEDQLRLASELVLTNRGGIRLSVTPRNASSL